MQFANCVAFSALTAIFLLERKIREFVVLKFWK